MAACPDLRALEHLVVGQTPLPELESLLSHMETCPDCFEKIQTLSPRDTLVDVLAKVKPLAQAREEEAVARLIDRLLRMTAAPVAETTQGAAPTGIVDDDETAESERWSFLAASQAPDEIGRLGAYRVLKVLGQGGMGVVFQAEDPALRRLVALKAMLPAIAASAAARKRFLREARATAALKHDNVVAIYQVSEDGDAPFLAMEFLHGESLDQRLKRDKVLPLRDVVNIGRQVAEGLAAAHDQGLIHRDIKPGNIWLEARPGGDERVKILDFGLARAADDQVGLTAAGMIVGTPGYMAPEQATGKPVDRRCDLFSLGAMLYHIATGERPFKGSDTLKILMALATDNPRPPVEINAELPPELSNLILKLLAKDSDQRPTSAHEVADALRALEATGSSRRSDAAAAAPRPARPRSRMLTFAALGNGLYALIAAGLVFYIPAGDGTIRIEVNDDAIEVMLTSTGARIKTPNGQGDVVVAPGAHRLKVKRGNLEFETDRFVLKKGETVIASVAWLKDRLVALNKADGKELGSKAQRPPSWPFDPADGKEYVWSVPKLVGGSVNTEEAETLWGVSDDERTLYYCRENPVVSSRPRIDSPFGPGAALGTMDPIEAQGAVSANGLAIIVGRLANAKKKKKAADEWELWSASRSDTAAPFPPLKRLGRPVNVEGSAMHPTLSADGLTLLISSDRLGWADIWMFRRDTIDAPFTQGAELPEPVNTPFWDMPYYISNDRLFLIAARQFERDGQQVREVRYFKRVTASSPWEPGLPLGLPLGAAEDNQHSAGFRLSGDGRRIYFYSPVLPNGVGNEDIWVSERVLKG